MTKFMYKFKGYSSFKRCINAIKKYLMAQPSSSKSGSSTGTRKRIKVHKPPSINSSSSSEDSLEVSYYTKQKVVFSTLVISTG